MKTHFDLLTLYNFLRRLTTPFTEFYAYELGLIDDEGTVLKKRSQMTSKEKEALTRFDVLILNLKKLLAKVPGGNTRIGTFTAALLLLKEDEVLNGEMLLEEYEIFERSSLAEMVTTAVSAGTSGDPRTRPSDMTMFRRKKKENMNIVEYISKKNKKKRYDNFKG